MTHEMVSTTASQRYAEHRGEIADNRGGCMAKEREMRRWQSCDVNRLFTHLNDIVAMGHMERATPSKRIFAIRRGRSPDAFQLIERINNELTHVLHEGSRFCCLPG